MSAAAALPWVVRVVWVALALTAGPAFGAALDGRSVAVRTVASVGLWAVWAAVVLATLVPRPIGLTLLRVAAPAAVVAAAAAVVAEGADLAGVLAVVTTAVTAVVALLPETGWLFVNGAAYGAERRHLLRAPGPLLAGPLVVAWAALVASVVAGPLLLAARSWVAGSVALLVGVPVVVVVARALHALTQRWAVFVPAGLVLKDHLAIVDPVLLRRADIAAVGPAPAGTDALDLTARAPGLALELRLDEPIQVTRVLPGRGASEAVQPTRLLFSPTRPGAVLADAEQRRIPVG